MTFRPAAGCCAPIAPCSFLIALALVGACTTPQSRLGDRRNDGAHDGRLTSATPLVDAGVASADEPATEATAVYPWGPAANSKDHLDRRFRALPPGFRRVPKPAGSFGEFLSTLPLQPEGSPVLDFRGKRLHQDGHH